MADLKITELPASAGLDLADLLAVVDDVAGTPATQKATFTQLMALVDANASITESQISNLGTSIALVSDNLSVFAATTSAQLATVISDEVGSAGGGLLVFNQSPTIVTPTIADFTNATHDHLNAAGGGQITEAAISDLGAYITASSNDILTNKTMNSFTNDIRADEIHIQVRNESGFTLNKGDAVYRSGYNAGLGLVLVDFADASDSLKMPAIGLVESDNIPTTQNGTVIISGKITGIDTNSFNGGDGLYVDTSGATGNITNVKPTGVSWIQKVGIVLRKNLTLGEIEVVGAGRVNDLPNIPSANFWLGNGTGVPAEVTMSVDATMDNTGAVTIANNAVTYAKMQDVTATSRFLGRITAGAGDTEELTGTQATTLLDVFTSGLKGLAPSSGGGTTNFLRADGTWAAPPGGASPLTTKGDLYTYDTGDQRLGVGGNNQVLVADSGQATGIKWDSVQTASIADEAVTFAKMQHITSDRLLGRDTVAAGDVEEISLNSTLEFTGAGAIQRAALAGDVTASAGSNTTTVANVPDGALAAQTTLTVINAGAGTNPTLTSNSATNNLLNVNDQLAINNVGAGADPILFSNDAGQVLDLTGSLDVSGALTLGTALAIGQGGSGQTTQQAAINALTNVSAATNEHVLTKDTATGDAVWKVAPGAGGGITSINAETGATQTLTGQTDKILISSATNDHAFTLGTDVVTIDKANTFGAFDQTFLSTRLVLRDSDNTNNIDIATSAETLDRVLTIPVLGGDRSIVVTGVASQITLGTEVDGAITNLSDVTAKTGSGTTVVFDTSPTIVTPTIASFANATHDHADAAGGGQLLSTSALSDTANIAYLAQPNTFTQDQIIKNSDNETSLTLYDDVTTPTDDVLIGSLLFNSDMTTGTNVAFARIDAKTGDVTDATSSGVMNLIVRDDNAGRVYQQLDGETQTITLQPDEVIGLRAVIGATDATEVNVVIGAANALAQSATDGFLYIPQIEVGGAPSGTPTSFTGKTPMVFDTVNDNLYVWGGATWINVTGGGSQTPWASDIDASTNSLSNLDILDFDDNVDAPTAAAAQIWWDAATGMNFNVPTGDIFQFRVNNTLITQLDVNTATFNGQNVLLQKTDANPIITIYDDQTTPADTILISELDFNSDTDMTSSVTYGSIRTLTGDVSDATSSGIMRLFVRDDNFPTIYMQLDGELQQVQITNSTLAMSSNAIDFTTGYIEFGTTPATTGDIRLENNTIIGWRNAGNTADITLGLDTDNQMELVDAAYRSESSGTSLGYQVMKTGTLADDTTIGNFSWRALDGAGVPEEQPYARLRGVMESDADTAEEGSLAIELLEGGTNNILYAQFNDAGGNDIDFLKPVNLSLSNATATLILDANHTTAADGNVIGQLDFKDTTTVAPAEQQFAQIRAVIQDPANASYSAELMLGVAENAGAIIDYIVLNETDGLDVTIKKNLDLGGNTLTNLADITSITNLNGVAIGNYIISTDTITALTNDTPANYNTKVTGDSFAFLGVNNTFTGANIIDNATGLTFNNQGAGGDPVIFSNDAGQVLDITGGLDVSGTFTAGTYTGQSSIVTVGTIGTGTWQGDVVASAYLDADTMHLSVSQNVTGAKDFDSGTVIYNGATSGTITLNATAVAGTNTLTLPAATDTLVGKATTDIFTNKTFDANGAGNSITNIEVADLAAAAVVTEGETITSNDNDTTVPTSAAVKNYADAETAILTNKTFDLGGAGNVLTGSVTEFNTALQSETFAYIGVANAWGDGIKQTFNPNATNAGINVGAHTAEPSTPANGDVFYDSTANQMKGRINGAWVDLGQSGSEVATWTQAHDAAGFQFNLDGSTMSIIGDITTTNNMQFTVPSGDTYDFDVTSSGTVVQIDSTGLDVQVGTVQEGGTDISPIGVHDIWVGATGMWPTTTSGCSPLAKVELGTNDIDIQTLDFTSTTADERAQFTVTLPRNWNEGAITVTLHWSHAGAATGNVNWRVGAVAVDQSENLDATLTFSTDFTDAAGTANQLQQVTSASFTPGGTPQPGDQLQFEIMRQGTDAADTFDTTARLHGAVIHITTDAATAA